MHSIWHWFSTSARHLCGSLTGACLCGIIVVKRVLPSEEVVPLGIVDLLSRRRHPARVSALVPLQSLLESELAEGAGTDPLGTEEER